MSNELTADCDNPLIMVHIFGFSCMVDLKLALDHGFLSFAEESRDPAPVSSAGWSLVGKITRARKIQGRSLKPQGAGGHRSQAAGDFGALARGRGWQVASGHPDGRKVRPSC